MVINIGILGCIFKKKVWTTLTILQINPQKNPEFSFLLSFCAFTCNRRRGSRLTGRTTVCLGSKEALTAFDVIFIHLFCGYYCGRSFPQKTTLRTASPPLNCQITTAPVGSVETKRSCVKHCCKTSRHRVTRPVIDLG